MSISTGNRNRTIAICLLAFLPAAWIIAQEPAVFQQHLQNPMCYNPAFAGERSIPGFSIHSRQQWLGWEGSPSYNFLTAHTRLKDKNAGVGAALSYDRMGPLHRAGVTGIYSYSLQTGSDSRLVLGLQGELQLLQIRLSRLQLVDQGDRLFEEDPGMKLQPNVGVGLRFIRKNYQVHLSAPRLLDMALSPFDGETSQWSRSGRVFFLGARSTYRLNEDFEAEPALLFAVARGMTPFAEIAGTAYYRKRFGAGLTYRFDRTIGARISYVHREMLIFGYAYDVSLGLLAQNAGTHELFLGYNFPFNRTKTLSPRRF